jgi:uncharacterized protein (TIGR00251 family)
VVGLWSDVLKYADISLRKDKSVVLKAAKTWSSALKFADQSLKKDRSFVLELVKQGGFSLFYVDKIFRKDSLIVKITQVPDKGKANKEIVKELKKLFGTDIEIVFGLKSKEKKIKFNLPKESIITLLETQANSKNQ